MAIGGESGDYGIDDVILDLAKLVLKREIRLDSTRKMVGNRIETRMDKTRVKSENPSSVQRDERK